MLWIYLYMHRGERNGALEHYGCTIEKTKMFQMSLLVFFNRKRGKGQLEPGGRRLFHAEQKI